MTNILYPGRRTLFFALVLAGVSAVTVAAVAVRSAVNAGKRYAVFTVHSGERLSTMWGRLEAKGLASAGALRRISSSVAFPSYPFVPSPSNNPGRFEGLFVPGSYRIALPADRNGPQEERLYRDDLRIVNRLLGRFAARLVREGLAVDASSYRDIILASIVQKEDVPARNYALVASVFLNRLKAGMHLGSCPTLEYALGYHRPFLLDSDVAVKSPYNTYLNAGLPPTPICFFTDRALKGVLHPASSPYYFFVLNWVTNRITFAKTYAEQKKNANIARKEFIKAYGKARLHKKEIGVFY